MSIQPDAGHPRPAPAPDASGTQTGRALAHVQNTNSQDHLPAIGKKIAYKANREGVAERCADPAVHKSIEVALARITYDDALLCDVERTLRQHRHTP